MGNWRTWLKGLAAAVIAGASNAITVAIVDPQAFPLSDLQKVGTVALVSAVVGAALYLKQSPLPTDDQA